MQSTRKLDFVEARKTKQLCAPAIQNEIIEAVLHSNSSNQITVNAIAQLVMNSE